MTQYDVRVTKGNLLIKGADIFNRLREGLNKNINGWNFQRRGRGDLTIKA